MNTIITSSEASQTLKSPFLVPPFPQFCKVKGQFATSLSLALAIPALAKIVAARRSEFVRLQRCERPLQRGDRSLFDCSGARGRCSDEFGVYSTAAVREAVAATAAGFRFLNLLITLPPMLSVKSLYSTKRSSCRRQAPYRQGLAQLKLRHHPISR